MLPYCQCLTAVPAVRVYRHTDLAGTDLRSPIEKAGALLRPPACLYPASDTATGGHLALLLLCWIGLGLSDVQAISEYFCTYEPRSLVHLSVGLPGFRQGSVFPALPGRDGTGTLGLQNKCSSPSPGPVLLIAPESACPGGPLCGALMGKATAPECLILESSSRAPICCQLLHGRG